MSTVAALILAAGQGKRFDAGHKLLADFRGKPIVRHVAEAALGSRAKPVVIVTGHGKQEIEEALNGCDLIYAHNPNFAEGLSTSLRTGFEALPVGVQGSVVLLADMPLVNQALINAMIDAWLSYGRPTALVPTFHGKRGNPVLLAMELTPQIETIRGDVGAGAFLRQLPGVIEWPTEEFAVTADIDTKEGLDDLRRSLFQADC